MPHDKEDQFDEVLIDVTKIISKNISKIDLFGRFGGDEFGILLKDCNKEKAISTIQKISDNIKEYSLTKPYSTSCTFGIEVVSNSQSLSEVIKKADTDMYKQKAAK